MKRVLCTAVVLALVSAGCSTGGGGKRMFSEAEPRTEGFRAGSVPAPNPTAPNIFVTADQRILVDQEPIYPPPGDHVTIYFGLEQNGLYEFPPNGIAIQEQPRACTPQGQFVVMCAYSRPNPPVKYHYRIRVRPVGGGQVIMDLDPTVMN